MKVGKLALKGNHVDKLWVSGPMTNAYITGSTFLQLVVWHQTGSFAHNTPNSPGLSRPRLPEGVCFGTVGHFCFLEVSNALGWFSRRGAWPAPPSLCPLREQSSIVLKFVFQELPLWGGAAGQPCLSTITAYVYVRKPGIQVFLIWVLILFLLHLMK